MISPSIPFRCRNPTKPRHQFICLGELSVLVRIGFVVVKEVGYNRRCLYCLLDGARRCWPLVDNHGGREEDDEDEAENDEGEEENETDVYGETAVVVGVRSISISY